MKLTAQHLKQLLENQFPIDTVSWARATDEVRDMSRGAREVLGLDEAHAVNFRIIRSPSEWNQKGIESIVRFFGQMTEVQQREFTDRFSNWLNEWAEH